jgi:hypothetical protein
MILPSRPPLERQSYHLGLNYYDHETAVQEDGRIASFSYSSDEHEKGWQFKGHQDKYGFHIWTEEDHKRLWSDDYRVEELLLTHRKSYTDWEVKEHLGPDFKVSPFEELWAYEYGGALSMRGGWFVTDKGDSYRILRSTQTRMS